MYTIAELFGLGVATVHNIVKEVCEAIIRNLQYCAKVMQTYFAEIRGFSWLFHEKNIEFSMEANFRRKVTIICDAYYFQQREFLNDNSFGTKIYFEICSVR